MRPNSVTNCTSKKTYPSKEAAEKTVAYLAGKSVFLRAYKCWLCEEWHLTGNDNKKKKRIS